MPSSPHPDRPIIQAYADEDEHSPRHPRPHWSGREMRLAFSSNDVIITVCEDLYRADTYHPISTLLYLKRVTRERFLANPWHEAAPAMVIAEYLAPDRPGSGEGSLPEGK